LKSEGIKKILLVWSGFVVSAAMLTVIQPPISWAPLAWVSLVPFVLVCSPSAKHGRLAIAAYPVSACYWLGNLYWVFPITWLGWLAFCLYTALLWPILAICLRYCRIKKIPLFLAVPVLFVGAERLQGLFLGGFLWRHLSHSQYANITLIQIADIFGAAGLSFLIAMVNGLLADLVLDARYWKSIFKISNLIKTSLVCAALVATIAYGQWRINQEDELVTIGPLVASLQSNVPQSVKESGQASDKIFSDLLQNSKAAAQAGAELIVWPETMVQAVLDPRVLTLLDSSHPWKIFDETLKEHSKDTAYILVGGYGGTPRIKEDSTIHLVERYNSAFLYRPDGTKAEEQYSKIHLVPFGEYVPFRKTFPFLYNVLMKFTPYDFDYSLDEGTEYTVFKMRKLTGPPQSGNPTAEKKSNSAITTIYKFSVMICYEDAVPVIARRFAIDQQGQKQIDWLVNISNDGWFVRFKDGKVFPSTELPQHAAICAFRAVENRLSILRSVNTGISCLIDSSGRIRDSYIAGSDDFPVVAMERKGLAGWFADKMPIDKRITFFSKYGQWLDFCCASGVILLIIVMLLERFVRTKKYTELAR
jgi:apolipoprotein N-acyltransferase